MLSKINNIYIQSIVTSIPKTKNIIKIPKKNIENINRVKKVIGVKTSYVVKKNQTTLDLCIHSANHLFKINGFDKNKIKIIICVTQTPDYLMPSNANKVQQILKLADDCCCFDINLGCSGYVYGLWSIFSIMKLNNIQHGLLLVGDTISKTIKKTDYSHSILFGDAGSASLIGNKKNISTFFNIGSQSHGFDKLILNNSAFKNNSHFKPEFFMDGKEVFLFAIKNVPILIKKLIKFSKFKIKNNYFVFHQANKFMLDKIFDELKVDKEFRLFSINNFGNTSSASIPLTLCLHQKKIINVKNPNIVAGFGAGFSYAAAIIDLKHCKKMELIQYE